MTTFAPPVDVLVASSVPGANEALAAGHTARTAAMRADYMAGERARREERPLPAEGTREHGWATKNRASYAAECDQATREAVVRAELYARRLATVRGFCPRTAYEIETAVGMAGR